MAPRQRQSSFLEPLEARQFFSASALTPPAFEQHAAAAAMRATRTARSAPRSVAVAGTAVNTTLPYGTSVGSILTTNGVTVTAFSNAGAPAQQAVNSYNGIATGLRWECVEFVNRYYAAQYGVDLRSVLRANASGYFSGFPTSLLQRHSNGGTVAPQVGDILAWDGGPVGNGHVAIIRRVDAAAGRVNVIHQNVLNGRISGDGVSTDGDFWLPYTTSGGRYVVDTMTSSGSKLGGTHRALGWLRLNRPANDDFASGTWISGASVTTTGSNRYATKESGEPNHGSVTGGKSVWFHWTALASGRVTIDTSGSNFDTILGVYAGWSLQSTTYIAGNDDYAGSLSSQVTFNATAGTTYKIAVDGYGGATGNFNLRVNQSPTFTMPSPIPSAPTNLTWSRIQAGQVRLNWTNTSSGESGFRLQCQSGGSWYTFATLAQGTNSVSVNAGAGSSWALRVVRFDLSGVDRASDPVTATF